MQIAAFRVRNFRSIVDTGWQALAEDGVTALVGQNESGKSSVLDAIYAFETEDISEDDFRSDGSIPEVSISYTKIQTPLGDFDATVLDAILNKTSNPYQRINIIKKWSLTDGKYECLMSLEEEGVRNIFPIQWEVQNDSAPEELLVRQVSLDKFLSDFWKLTPVILNFSEDDSILPSKIDLKDIDDRKSTVRGLSGVLNFVEIAGLDTSKLRDSNSRNVRKHLKSVESRISDEFQKFWSQKIGDNGKIHFSCDLKHHSVASSGVTGEPYLELAIIHNDDELLYPHQRSRGVIWYLSFFLQLMAKAKIGQNQLILIDEPGSSLHAKAQEDVLKLFEALKGEMQIMYSTHSPYLIQPDKLYRVLAAQRNETGGNFVTTIMTAHQLGSANYDTLMPVYAAMGLNFSQIPVVLKDKNIVLEEKSCHYYIKAFYSILKRQCPYHFLPAQGVTKVPLLANLLLGWGLKYAIVVDDDRAGRDIFNQLKLELFHGDEKLIKARMAKLPFPGGIENVFSRADFLGRVAEDSECNTTKTENHEMVKDSAKGMIAARFLIKVLGEKVVWGDLSVETQTSIEKVIEVIESLDA